MMLAMWASPIVYSWSMVVDAIHRLGLPAWVLEIYTANPITLAVLGFHKAFWGAGTAPPTIRPTCVCGWRSPVVIGLVLLFMFASRLRAPAGQLRAGAVNGRN